MKPLTAHAPILPHENDILEKLTKDGYFKAIDKAKLSKKKFLETLMQVQEEERKKLGHELHDSVNSSLTIAKFYLSLLNAGTEKEKYAKEQLAFIISTTEQSIRTISCELVVFQETDSGLIDLVSNLIARINDLNVFKATFRHSNKKLFNELPGCQKIVLYRIIQEQLNNTIKYSKASKVNIDVKLNGKIITLVIKDNGIGFDMAKRRSGIGLANIISRASQFNGHAHIQTAPGMGCQLSIQMPVLE
jgi:signal transduction histidine kinase